MRFAVTILAVAGFLYLLRITWKGIEAETIKKDLQKVWLMVKRSPQATGVAIKDTLSGAGIMFHGLSLGLAGVPIPPWESWFKKPAVRCPSCKTGAGEIDNRGSTLLCSANPRYRCRQCWHKFSVS